MEYIKKKVLTYLATIVLLIIAIFLLYLYVYLGAYPAGFHKGRLMVYRYFCSDVCPDYGDWHYIYFGIEKEEDCEAIDGYPVIDNAWGDFIGCSPTLSKYTN